jgi:hypothetical protein
MAYRILFLAGKIVQRIRQIQARGATHFSPRSSSWSTEAAQKAGRPDRQPNKGYNKIPEHSQSCLSALTTNTVVPTIPQSEEMMDGPSNVRADASGVV